MVVAWTRKKNRVRERCGSSFELASLAPLARLLARDESPSAPSPWIQSAVVVANARGSQGSEFPVWQ